MHARAHPAQSFSALAMSFGFVTGIFDFLENYFFRNDWQNSSVMSSGLTVYFVRFQSGYS